MPLTIPYWFLGSFLATVFALQWWILPSYPVIVWVVLTITGIASAAAAKNGRAEIFALFFGITCAFLSVSHAADRGRFADLDLLHDLKKVTVNGTVIGQPDDRGTKVQFVLQTDTLRRTVTGTLIPMRARMLITDQSMGPMPAPGDKLEVAGRLVRVDAGSGYDKYLRMRNIGEVIESRRITFANEQPGQTLGRTLWQVKLGFQDHLRSVLPEPAAGLLDGLLTGSNGGLSLNVQSDFRTTGLSHIVAVSGSNITVILSVLSGMLFFLPLRWRFLPCAIGIILFTIFVGASASVVRAAITGIIGLVALQSGRQNDARLATLWTAFGMLCWNPWQLWADAGFQLSFLAVIGLIELTPFLEPMLKKIPDIGGMREALTATLAAQFTAVPWGIALFQSIPLISPLSNVVVAPLIPLAMMTGSLGLLVAWIMPPLALIAGLPSALLLNGIIWLAHIMALMPFASVSVTAFPSWLIAIYYLLLATGVMILRRRTTNDTAAPSHPSVSL